MSAIIKDVEFPSGIVCSYWTISKFSINLDNRNIEVVCKAYKNKQAFQDGREPVEIRTIQVDTGYYDLAIESMASNGFNPEEMYYSILNSIDMFRGTIEIN